MLTLTSDEMEALTSSEQHCARMLGLNASPQKRPRKSHSKCAGGESYILVTTMSCRLCSSLHKKVFQMVKQGSSLSGCEIPEIPTKEKLGKMKVKESHHTTRCCKNCYNHLKCFKKKDLINKFLSYINDGRNFLI